MPLIIKETTFLGVAGQACDKRAKVGAFGLPVLRWTWQNVCRKGVNATVRRCQKRSCGMRVKVMRSHQTGTFVEVELSAFPGQAEEFFRHGHRSPASLCFAFRRSLSRGTALPA